MHFRRLLSTALAVFSLVSARAEQVVISEIMYQPSAGKPEFVEVSNITGTPLDIARWNFADGFDFTFPDFAAGSPQAHILKPLERIIVSSATPAATRTAYPSIPVSVRIFGPWLAPGALSNDGERITLKDKNGVIACTVQFADSGRWPIAPDGAGHSLVLANENKAIDDWRVWRQSTQNGGSPGVADPAAPAKTITLNEVHFAASGRVDWIELRNDSRTTTVPADGLFVASKNDFSDKVALGGNVTPGALTSVNVDFAANGDAEVKLYLIDANNHVKDAVKITRKPGRDSWQEFPAGSNEWFNDVTDTRDAQNAPARNTDIVINEIMADPPSNQRDGEFVELYNRGTNPVDVGGWELKEGINYTIPAGTIMQPGGYLVIAANASWLNANYTGLAAIGNWDGQLANSGEMLKLDDANGNLVNAVDFRFGGEWPELAAGNGSSLELANPNTDNTIGGAWQDSNESQKSSFQSFSINGGIYQKSSIGGTQDDEIRIWAVGDSHIILKNIVLRPTAGGANLLTNAAVATLNDNNVDGWQSHGTHADTFHNAEGVHLVADGHGDNKINHIQKAAPGMAASTGYTLEFEARWVWGKPRLVTQSWDTTWGGTTAVQIPSNLGTPGGANSRLSANPSPQITSLLHSPAVPAAGQTVTVTARVSTLTPLQSVQLLHRLDNINANGTWNTTPMNDTGTAGDVSANDGIYTAQVVPGNFSYGPSAIVDFYVRATAANGAVTRIPRDGPAVPGVPGDVSAPEPWDPLWRKRYGTWAVGTAGPADMRRMRIVMSAYWLHALDSSSGGNTSKFNFKYPRLSARYFPCTFIHNDAEIYYGSKCRKTGSPWTRQNDNLLARGRVVVPGDNPVRGKTKMYWDNDGNASMLHNRITRYWLYLLGVPGNENEFCRVARNGEGFTIRETNEVFDKEMLDRIWENGSDGQFFEMDDKFWIADNGNTQLGNQDGSWAYKAGDSQGAENPTAYHNQFIPKSKEWEYDYSGFTEWTKQLTTRGSTITFEELERMADSRTMTAYAAVRGYIGDWDTITGRRGKNGYMYQRSTDHKWTFLHWDSDLAFQTPSEPVMGNLTNIPTYFNRHFIRQQMNYFLTEMLTTYSASGGRLTAWLDAEAVSPAGLALNPLFLQNKSNYQNWSANRAGTVQAYIGAAFTNNFAATNPTPGGSTTAHTITVTGTAPSRGYRIECVSQPKAVLTWNSESSWSLAGIVLENGANNLEFRMVDMYGNQVGAVINYTINKTNDAPPIPVLTSSPTSRTVALGEIMRLDGSASYDPEGAGDLTYAWTITPSTGVTVTEPSAAQRTLVFNVPGTYTVTMQVTDAALQVASTTQTFTVYSSPEFDSFGGETLDGYTLSNVELRDGNSPNSWYSLNETDTNLVVQVLDTAPRPLTHVSPSFPLITRPLPPTADFILQTDFGLENRQFGTFFTGLWLEVLENDVSVKYAFGLENGSSFKLFRAFNTGGAFSVQIGSSAYAGGPMTIRVLRETTSPTSSTLRFQRLLNGEWITVASRPITNLVAVNGGLFVAAGSATPVLAQTVRVAFDYLLLANPANSSDLVTNLRLTEIMYNPSGGGVEYLEVKNIGSMPLDVTGAYFEEGQPWNTRFTFPNLILQPGQVAIVTNNVAGFRTRYGDDILIAGEATGGLANDTERIVLKDADSNVVFDVTYLDTWYPATDGGGKSLDVQTTDQTLYNQPTAWQPSVANGGSAGFLVSVSITDQPDGGVVNPGQQILLEASATGDPAPTFQWRKNGQPIVGATSPSYSVASATEADEGEYDVVARNGGSSAISQVALVLVNDPVVITSHPENKTANPGQQVTLSVAATGTQPFTYQWRFNGETIPGETGAELKFAALEGHEGEYDVIVSNVLGPVASNEAIVSVNNPVEITDGPDDQAITEGGTIALSVTATGTAPISYQWYKGDLPIEGATEPNFAKTEATAADAGEYHVVVSNPVGPVPSEAATVSVNNPLTITKQPSPQVVLVNGTATFSVEATGMELIEYQWLRNGTPIPGATSATLQIAPVTASDQATYTVEVKNPVHTVISDGASLTFLNWTQATGTYQGLLEGTELPNPWPGRVTFAIAKGGKFTGTLEHMGLKHRFRGVFDVNLNATVLLTEKARPLVTLNASFSGARQEIEVSTAHASVPPGLHHTGVLSRIPARTKASPTPLAGRYTMLLEPGTGVPAGLTASGYAAVNVTTKGAVTWTGKLVDGTNLKGSAALTSDNRAAFYSPLYVLKPGFAGHIAGPLSLTSTHANGDFAWRKPLQSSGTHWRTGFEMLVDAVGWKYRPPAAGVRAIAVTTARLTLTGPIANPGFSRLVTITPKNTFEIAPNSEKIKLRLSKSTGVMTGSFLDLPPAATRGVTRKLYGVVIQEENRAFGFFRGDTTAGSWELAQPE